MVIWNKLSFSAKTLNCKIQSQISINILASILMSSSPALAELLPPCEQPWLGFLLENSLFHRLLV